MIDIVRVWFTNLLNSWWFKFIFSSNFLEMSTMMTSLVCGRNFEISNCHYNDSTMNAVASLITGASIGYLTVYSTADQWKHQSSALLALCEGNSPVTGWFPAQRANNAENASIWWRHNAVPLIIHPNPEILGSKQFPVESALPAIRRTSKSRQSHIIWLSR